MKSASSLSRKIPFMDLLILFGILACIVAFFGAYSDRFITTNTLGSVANRIPTLTLAATGMTLVLLIGGIDLSVGSVLALGGAVLGSAMTDWQMSFLPAAALTVLACAALGLVNGSITVGLKAPAFIVTLGMLEMARGLGYMVTNSQTKYLGESVEGLAKPMGDFLISPAFLLALIMVFLMQALVSKTVFGRKMIAIGTNETATRLAGIDPRPIKIGVYTLTGILVGLGALCNVARFGASDPNAGLGLELSAIAAAVIGGTSLSGGRGSVVGTFMGVLIIATLEAGLAQVGASEPMKRIITGAVIILAVVADRLRKSA